MITTAGYLGAELCVKACSIKLSEFPLNQHSVLPVCNIMDKLRGCPSSVVTKLEENLWGALNVLRTCTDLDTAAKKTLQEALFGCLLDSYGDAHSIMNNNDLQVSFCKLPLHSIELWGSSDKVAVDSENTVVVLLNKWWHSRASQTTDCKTKLSGLVRLVFLSTSYLQYTLDKLDWFIAPFTEYKHACHIVNKYGKDRVDLGRKPYDKLVVTRRCSTLQQGLTLEWRIPLERILHVVNSTTDRTVKGPEGYWQGYTWKLEFLAEASNKGKDYVQIGLVVRKQPADLMPGNISMSCDVCIVGDPFGDTWKQVLFDNEYWWRYHTIKIQDVALTLEKKLTDDKHLPITVAITNVE